MSPRRAREGEVDWSVVIPRAAQVVREYDQLITLRQLYYILYQREGLIDNNKYRYQRLSELTAAARREGWFPPLVDTTRYVQNQWAYGDPVDAPDPTERMRRYLRAARNWRRPPAENQEVVLHIACEKNTMVGQLESWFEPYGIPVFACRGFGSESQERELIAAVNHARESEPYGREVVCIYAGDFDPSGVDIERNLGEHVPYDKVIRVAVTEDQIETYGLVENPGKESDSRAGRFVEEYGRLVQVEVEALDPNDLRALYQTEIDNWWDYDQQEQVEQQSEVEERGLRRVIDRALHLVGDHDIATLCEHPMPEPEAESEGESE